MKKIYALIVLLSPHLLAAQNTNFGTSSGTLGTNISYFGYFSGNASTAASLDNSFFGAYSGRLTTTGTRNTGIGSQTLYSNTVGYSNVAAGYKSLYSNTSGYWNTAIGYEALNFNTTGAGNTACGVNAMFRNTTGSLNTAYGGFALDFNTSGSYNTAVGDGALFSNTTASYNTASGYRSLYSNTTGLENTANGYRSLYSNTTGNYNTSVGHEASFSSTTSSYNTANGYRALYFNTTGYENTASGFEALHANVEGSQNTAYGYRALYSNSGATGIASTAIGWRALYYNVSGALNTAVGYDAMGTNTSGAYNVAQGNQALYINTTGSRNTATGVRALIGSATGDGNTAVGYEAGPSLNLNNTTAIGSSSVTTASNQVRIGNPFVTSIGGQVGWTTLSDGRFKQDIKEDVAGLEFINSLRPVSYVVNIELVNKFLGIKEGSSSADAIKVTHRQTGFIAQEVEKILNSTGLSFSGVDVPQNEKSHYGIRYAEFVVPLVKAVQELSARTEEQQKKIDILLDQINKGGTKDFATADETALFQNSPNPFSAETLIRVVLPDNALQATLIIYNLEGRQLKTISIRERGTVTVKIAGNALEAGMYLYTLLVDNKVADTKRMILTK